MSENEDYIKKILIGKDSSGNIVHLVQTDQPIVGTIARICGARLRLRIDFHQEYITITFILDISKNKYKINKDNIKRLLGLEEDIVEFNPKEGFDKNILYSKLWQKIDDVIGTTEIINNGKYNTYLQKCGAEGKRKSDSIRDAKKFHLIQFMGFCYFRNDKNDRIMSLSKNSVDRRTRIIGSQNREFVLAREQFFNKFLGGTPSSADDPQEDRNAILCEMLSGIAVYASSLGKARGLQNSLQPDVNSSVQPSKELIDPAVEYIIMYGGHSAERAGRLVRLLHVLGEMRHAALFDFSELREASIQLRQLGQLWHPGDNDGHKFRRSKAHMNSYYRYRLNKSRFTELGRLGSGDLSYRLQRSQFYADTFRARIEDLKCLPVPPFQSYDAFMFRNAYIHFEKFRSLSSRFKSTQAAMQYLETQNQTAKAEKFNTLAFWASIVAVIFGFTGIFQYLLERSEGENASMGKFPLDYMISLELLHSLYMGSVLLLILSTAVLLLFVFYRFIIVQYAKAAVAKALKCEKEQSFD